MPLVSGYRAAQSSRPSTSHFLENPRSLTRRRSGGEGDFMTERETLLHNVQMYDFALLEAALYLDSHPQNADALAYFKTQQALYHDAVDAYTQKYGPLQFQHGIYDNTWSWVNAPWPWEGADQ